MQLPIGASHTPLRHRAVGPGADAAAAHTDTGVTAGREVRSGSETRERRQHAVQRETMRLLPARSSCSSGNYSLTTCMIACACAHRARRCSRPAVPCAARHSRRVSGACGCYKCWQELNAHCCYCVDEQFCPAAVVIAHLLHTAVLLLVGVPLPLAATVRHSWWCVESATEAMGARQDGNGAGAEAARKSVFCGKRRNRAEQELVVNVIGVNVVRVFAHG